MGWGESGFSIVHSIKHRALQILFRVVSASREGRKVRVQQNHTNESERMVEEERREGKAKESDPSPRSLVVYLEVAVGLRLVVALVEVVDADEAVFAA